MEDESLQHRSRQSAEGSKFRSFQGMESVVATVSGYHGSERFNLIKLISQTGASYLGAMTRSTTHLVCWKFEGRKFSLASKFKTLIVNHRWVEDCIKAGKRIPEHPYILQSGEEVGPLLLKAPPAAKRAIVSYKRNDKELSGQSYKFDDSSKSLINERCGAARQSVWIDLCFQKEQEESISHYSTHSARQKRSICRDLQSISAEPSHKGRRLVKRNVSEGVLSSAFPDSEEECFLLGVSNERDNVTTPSNHSVSVRNGSVPRIQETTSNDAFGECGESINEGLESLEEIEDLNHIIRSQDSDLHIEDAQPAIERASQNRCSDVGNFDQQMEDGGQVEHITRTTTSTELSCVICWTDFSSTRGILPCGHRFCYSCIESWADHMASRRKISTCPLCKASFTSITKVDDVPCSDQKIYSQTIPFDPLKRDVLFPCDVEIPFFGAEPSSAPACCECCCREPVDLLISCHLCQFQCIHSYCLDPPLLPWACIHCKDLRTMYQHHS
ncbi:uncharacterized protein LOC131153199 isoform X2 [Malania oleifera]|uniref:uncharacterized protein LOC131153199 isoform X2 n=1 Tax=Malania oleifera TaxID=397392 RepID=UPI0025AEAB9F|nr:uncharacterized protein LOC131153199 isoform X2 [Malania oleifera]